MASIYKVERKNGTAYRAVIRRKDYPTISKTFNRKKDAVQWAREYDQEARLQKIYADRKGANRTVGELIDHYMYQYTGRDKTRVTRLSWWKERIGDRWLRTVDAETIDNALDELRNTPALRSNGSRLVSLKRPRSEATINKYHAATSAVFLYAIKKLRWMKQNPAREVSRGEESRGIVRFLSDDERERLLEACRGSKYSGLPATCSTPQISSQ